MENSTLLPSTERNSTATPKSASGSPKTRATLKNAKRGDWRPLSLTKPVLLTTLALSLLLFACIEILAQRSDSHNGLVFYPDLDSIPGSVSFAYRYLPTILATLFSLLWNWIDLDVKRVQPWIELSKPTGATAQNSILLDYSSYFLAAVPARAIKLRHWPVFLSGTAAVLILWVLTPLQSSLFGDLVVPHTTPATIIGRSTLAPPIEQAKNTVFLQLSYTIGSLNHSYPAFTTSEYALLPFYVNTSATSTINSTGSSIKTNWTAETTKIWADVNCSRIEPVYTGHRQFMNRSAIYNFTGSDGCAATVDFGFRLVTYPLLYYRDNSNSRVWTEGDWKCPNASSDPYSSLIFWANPLDPSGNTTTKFNITAFECGLSYYKQQVMATVDSETLLPYDDTIQPLSSRQDLTSDEFNQGALVQMIPVDNTYSKTRNRADYVDGIYPLLLTTEGTMGLETMYRYALQGVDYDIHHYSNPTQLENLFRSVQKQFLTLSVSTRLVNQTTTFNTTAEFSTYLIGITMSRPFAIASEVLLLLGALVLGSLCFFMKPSACVLDKIPSSVDGLVDIAHCSPGVRKLLTPMDTATEELMTHVLGETKFNLSADYLSKYNQLSIVQGGTLPCEKKGDVTPKSYYEPVKPWVLRRATGAGLVAFLIAGAVVLIYFKIAQNKNNGLSRPSENFEVLQILENYIPTAFSTLVEPFWVLLARTMCVFQPFKDLWKGKSAASKSIETSYTAVPPQLAFYKTITSRNFILSLLCFAAFLANVLAIGLSAIFNEQSVEIAYPHQFQSRYQSQLNESMLITSRNNTYLQSSDPLYLTLLNMTYNTQLMPWTSKEYFFQPVTIMNTDKLDSGDQYTVRTRGFGADLNCTSYPSSTHRLWTYNSSDFWDGNDLSCSDPMGDYISSFVEDGVRYSDSPAVVGAASLSIVDNTYKASAGNTTCAPNLMFGWAKCAQGLKLNHTITASFALCQPVFETAMFDTTIDRNGSVIGYQRVGDISSGLDYANSTNNIDWFLSIVNSHLRSNYVKWGNTSVTTSWADQFLYIETGSRDAMDPEKPVTNPEQLAPYLRRIYRQVFASILSSSPTYLVAADDKAQITGTRLTHETRIFMDDTAFIITMTVLAIDLLIALAFYIPESLYVLPRLPGSIGSILAYIAPSRAVRDGRPALGWQDQTFSFGRYMGYDGRSYVGIEMDPYVVEKDTSLGVYKPLLPTSLTNSPSEGTQSINADEQTRTS